MQLEDLPIVDLEVTDERFEGMVFIGTIESVYKQMKELKPELIPDTSDFTDSGVSTVDKRQSSVRHVLTYSLSVSLMLFVDQL